MTADEWTEQYHQAPTVVLPAFRILFLGCKGTGLQVHVTPTGYHPVEPDDNGGCICGHPLEA